MQSQEVNAGTLAVTFARECFSTTNDAFQGTADK